ncbi:MAG: SDR family oxidoreductase [Chitinophagaceae bacterium]|nr:MAG: SDR family oxidoreductase [Chitinophagaceae bacterium]
MITSSNSGYALVTGGTSGIGFEIAKLFAQNRQNLILVARSREGLLEIAEFFEKDYGVKVYTIAKDLFVPGAAKEIFAETMQQGFAVDYLVNDAGQGLWGKFADTNLDREIDLVHLNIIALMSLTKYYLREMILRNEGRILQLASALAKAPTPYMSVYAATKAFVLSFSEAVAREIKDTKITITTLLPNATDTDFFHKSGSEHTVTYRETSLYDPADIAKSGFEGMMKGEHQVVSGIKNKLQGAMTALMTDEAVTDMMHKQMLPSEKTKGREQITHHQSQKERTRINKSSGDYEIHKNHIHEDAAVQHPGH